MRWVFAAIFAAALSFLAHIRTDGFSPQVCQEAVTGAQSSTFDPSWPTRFTYLARGKQAFAFVSEDGQYVIKLFNSRHLNTPWYANIPGFFSARKARSLIRQRIFPESYRLAFDFLPQETGLLCVHMGKSTQPMPVIELTDKASRRFRTDLNNVAFVLQRRGHGTLLDKLSEVKHQPEKLQAILDAYLALHAKRIALSIADYDRDIRANYAWGPQGLMYIDPARFYSSRCMKDPTHLKHAWWGCTYRLRKWLVQNAPEHVAWFDERVRDLTLPPEN